MKSRANFLVERADVVIYLHRRASGLRADQLFLQAGILDDVAREIEVGLHAKDRKRETHHRANRNS